VIVEGGKFPWDNGKFPGMTEPSKGYHGVKFYETFGDFGFSMRARMETLRVYGATLSPMSAWQILQGVETLALRMERHCANALAVAKHLKSHPAVSWVNYPGLEDHPQHDLALKQMRKIEKECYPESDGEEESKINKSFNEVLKLKDQQIESLTIEKLNLEN
jgi:O-acetylhomoserine (thiol)-lyase